MGKIKGRLLADLHPNGTVRIVFIASIGGGKEAPLTAKDLNTAELVFMTCGLTRAQSAELRAELVRNKVVNLEASVEEAIAVKFNYPRTVG